MKIESNTFPPNYDLILANFPKCEEQKAVFTYGSTIYNPFNVYITPDIEVHEQTHSERHDNPDIWWHNYITDRDFRFNEELLAYAKQYRYAVDQIGSSKLTDWLLQKCAEALSSDLYKLGITYGEAKSKIRNMSKGLANNNMV